MAHKLQRATEIRLARILLLAFMVTQAIIPSGFMPNSLASGSPFSLCGGNAESAQILAVLNSGNKHHHHHHHHHDDGAHEASLQPLELCGFAALGLQSTFNATDQTPFSVLAPFQRPVRKSGSKVDERPFQRPHLRAPPSLS